MKIDKNSDGTFKVTEEVERRVNLSTLAFEIKGLEAQMKVLQSQLDKKRDLHKKLLALRQGHTNAIEALQDISKGLKTQNH